MSEPATQGRSNHDTIVIWQHCGAIGICLLERPAQSYQAQRCGRLEPSQVQWLCKGHVK